MPTQDDDRARATLVANELAKLSATYLNGLAIAVAVVGGLSPILTGDLSDLSVPALARSTGKAAVCLAVSGLLHRFARRLLKGLR